MKKTIKEIVAENKDRALACGTPKELYALAIELGFDSRSAFPRYKTALKEICGIDYDAVKQARNEQRQIALAESVTHEVTFYSDAKARCERFALCDAGGEVVWYGRFFDGEGSEQSASELEAALKAIWLASKVRNDVCQPGKTVRLNLFVDAQWLVTLSGKASALSDAARKFNIELNIQWIAGTTNPADRWTTASGYQSWKDADLKSLAVEIGNEPLSKDDAIVEISPVAVPAETASVLALCPDSTVAVEQAATVPAIESVAGRSVRGPEFQQWFDMMGSEWPKLRDEMKAKGMSSADRDSEVSRLVMEWVGAGKPALVA